jgi:CubicO group peptidase (beta-lactamase class C family)
MTLDALKPTISSAEAGFDPERLGALDHELSGMVKRDTVAGLVTLIARHGGVVQQGCYGWLDLSDGRPVQSDSLFRLASLTKPMTAAAVLALREEGRLDLHEPVRRWLPALGMLNVLGADGSLESLARDITVHHLLTHTAGFGYGFEPDDPLADAYREAGFYHPVIITLAVPLPELVQRLSALPLASQPGERYRYSLSYDLLGYLVEIVSGRPFGDFLRERLFDRLGMDDTAFFVPPEKQQRFGPLYGPPSPTGIQVLDDPRTGAWSRPDAGPSGGGGLVSSLGDVYRFFAMLVNGGEFEGRRVLRPDTVRAMLTSQVDGYVRRHQGTGYGVGVALEGMRAAGWPAGMFAQSGGTGTQAFGSQPARLVHIFLTQSLGNLEPARRFADMAFQAMNA